MLRSVVSMERRELYFQEWTPQLVYLQHEVCVGRQATAGLPWVQHLALVSRYDSLATERRLVFIS
jgi:hypothetical protein